jgi:DNA polymerase III delta subunit
MDVHKDTVVATIRGKGLKTQTRSFKTFTNLSCDNYRPEELLQYVHGRVKASREEIKEALTGYVTDHHRFMLQTLRSNISKLDKLTVA